MTSEQRWSPFVTRHDSNKFPDFEQTNTSRDHLAAYQEERPAGGTSSRTPSPHTFPAIDRTPSGDRWNPRQDGRLTWSQGLNKGYSRGHGRQKSLSDAIRTIRTRKGSVSANAQEIAEALKAPLSVKLIVSPSILKVPLTCH